LRRRGKHASLGQGEEEVLIEELMAGTDIREYCDTIDQRPTSGDVLILAAIADVFKRYAHARVHTHL
jgi:hypothetical protein